MLERSKARAWALHTLYAWEAREDTDLEVVLDEFMTRRLIAPSRRDYLRRLVTTVAEHRRPIDAALQEAISNWRIERLSVIDRNVLRLGAAEMLYLDDIPPRVSIREALKLAERYGTDESPRFVNGVLDALMKRLERE
ncbi:MAG: transcription antitermination factor NusB [Longimicrobiales bacterium]|nr:transcription antitermination factor NusB [Longimicrobiales bacterium]